MQGIRYVGLLNHKVHSITEHQHPCFEFVYYTEGCGVLELADKSYPFSSHDVFVIPPYTNHLESSAEGFKNYHFTFTNTDLEIHGLLHITDSSDQVILPLVRQLHHEFHMKRNNWEHIINDYGRLLEQYLIAFDQPAEPMNPDVNKVITAIINHYPDPLFVARKSMEHLPYHVDHFRKLFMAQTAKTPARYLLEKRIAHAAYLIETAAGNGITLKEIAHASGFLDYYHFSRVFKTHLGVSPKAYRKRFGHGS